MPRSSHRTPLTWDDFPRREQRAALVRVALFHAAREAVEERPFSEVTVKSLCAQVGVTEPTFFNHFPEKSDLLVYGIMLWGIETSWQISKLDPSMGPVDKIDWLFEYASKLFAGRPGFARELLARQASRRGPPKFIEITLAERVHAFPECPGIERFPGHGIVAILTPLVRRAKSAGLLPDSPTASVVVEVLVSTFFGVPTFTMWEDPAGIARRYRQQLAIFWRGMGAQR